MQLAGEEGPLVGLGVEDPHLRPPDVVRAADPGADPDDPGRVLEQVDGHGVDGPPVAVPVPEPEGGQLHRDPRLEEDLVEGGLGPGTVVGVDEVECRHALQLLRVPAEQLRHRADAHEATIPVAGEVDDRPVLQPRPPGRRRRRLDVEHLDEEAELLARLAPQHCGGHQHGDGTAAPIHGPGPDPEAPQHTGPGVFQGGEDGSAVVGMGEVLHRHPGEFRFRPVEEAAHGGVGPEEQALRREQRQLRDGLLEGRLEDLRRRRPGIREVDLVTWAAIAVGHGDAHGSKR